MNLIRKIILIIILLCIFFITTQTKNDKMSYISLGDGLSKGINQNNYKSYGYSDYISNYLKQNNKLKMYTKNFTDEDMRITDLIEKIKDNEYTYINNNKITIQNVIKNANIITISVGINEILYKYNNEVNESYMYSYIEECMNDMKELINLIKKYNNKKIVILGYYNPKDNTKLDKFIINANNELEKISNEEKINFISLYNIFKNNKHLIYNSNNYYPNQDGYKLIANEIIKMLNFSK